MPTYPFVCPDCHSYTEEIRTMRDAANIAICPSCHQIMNRVYSLPQVSVPAGGYYNYGLGCYVNGPKDVKDALKRNRDGYYEDKTIRVAGDPTGWRNIRKEVKGRELVEVGNEKQTVTKPHKDYVLPRGALDGIGSD